MRRELAALVARSPFGQVAVWPVVETVQRDGICVEVLAPAPGLAAESRKRAQELALRIADELGRGRHARRRAVRDRRRRCWSTSWRCARTTPATGRIDGARTSQFEQHLRAVLDYPLGDTGADRAGRGDGQRARRAAADDPAMEPRRAAPPPVRRTARRQGAPVRQGGAAGPQARPRQRRSATTSARSVRERARRAAGPLVVARANGLDGWDEEHGMSRAAPGRHDHGQRLRLAGDGGRREALAEFDVPFEVGVVSAHRTPAPDARLRAQAAAGRGLRVIIAGAGGAAHLPGMVASATPLPVIGVPVPLARLDGLDSLLSIVQMPAGRPGGDGVDRRRPATPVCSPSGSWRRPTPRCASGSSAFQADLASIGAARRTRACGSGCAADPTVKLPASTLRSTRWLVTRSFDAVHADRGARRAARRSARSPRRRSRRTPPRSTRRRASRSRRRRR